jgi:hypothetical protein
MLNILLCPEWILELKAEHMNENDYYQIPTF